MKKCKVISIANQKGGVGKTSTTLGLAAAAALEGEKVLLIDFDGQLSLTHCCQMQDKENILSALEFGEIPAYEFRENIFVTPADEYLYMDNDLSDHGFIKQLIDKKREEYTMILCDLSPSLSMLHTEVLFASDFVLIPSLPGTLDIEGVDAITKQLERVKSATGYKPEILGVFLSKVYSNRNLHKFMLTMYQRDYGDYMLNTMIPDCTAIAEAQAMRKTIFEYSPKCKAATAYKDLYKEISTRIK